MSIKDLLQLKDTELNIRLTELTSEVINTRLRILDGTESNTAKIRKIKRETARIHTILSERKRS